MNDGGISSRKLKLKEEGWIDFESETQQQINMRPGTAKHGKASFEFHDLYKLTTFKPGERNRNIERLQVASIPRVHYNSKSTKMRPLSPIRTKATTFISPRTTIGKDDTTPTLNFELSSPKNFNYTYAPGSNNQSAPYSPASLVSSKKMRI